MDRDARPAPGRDPRDLVGRTSSDDSARVQLPDDDFPAGSRGRPLLTVEAVVTAVSRLQKRQPRGARFAEILAVLGPVFPSLTASCLRRELAPVLKRAVGSRLLRCDLRRNYTVLHRQKAHGNPDFIRQRRGASTQPIGPDQTTRRQQRPHRGLRQASESIDVAGFGSCRLPRMHSRNVQVAEKDGEASSPTS